MGHYICIANDIQTNGVSVNTSDMFYCIIPTVIIKQFIVICMVMNQAAGILWFSKEHRNQEDLLLLAGPLYYEK